MRCPQSPRLEGHIPVPWRCQPPGPGKMPWTGRAAGTAWPSGCPMQRAWRPRSGWAAGRRVGRGVGGAPWSAGTRARVWEQAGPPGQRSLEHRWWPRRPPAHAAAGSAFCPAPRSSGEPLAAEGHSSARRKPAPGAAVTASAGRPASIRPAALCLWVSQPVSALGDSAGRLPRAVLPAPDSLPLPGRGTHRSTRRLLPSANRGGVSPGRPDEGERGGRAGCRRESKVAQRERGTVRRGSPAAWLLKPWGGEETAYARGDPRV